MTTAAERRQRAGAGAASLAIDNLRAVVILLVIAFHAVLPYLAFLPQHPFAFDATPFTWRSFPIVDTERFLGFDLFCAWLDVFLMSFFFLLSGLFAWPSLGRKGPGAFLADRVLRLALPFAVVVTLVMPPTHYPTYLQTAADPSVVDYWRHWLALPLWPSGPMWFLWLLLIGDAMAAGLFWLMAGRRDAVVRLAGFARQYAARFLTGFALAVALGYVPLALLFGGSDWAQWGPFSLQLGRPVHYALYFLCGVALGAGGIEASLLAPDGKLARHWARWLLAAGLSFVLWVALTALVRSAAGQVSLGLRLAGELSFSLACFASCFFALAVALRFGRVRATLLDSLAGNAYGIYLIHYLFIVWLQYALLAPTMPAIAKAAIVFSGALALSWSTSAGLRRIPACGRIIGPARQRSRRPAQISPATVPAAGVIGGRLAGPRGTLL